MIQDRHTFNLLGVPLNLGAFGLNLNRICGWITLRISDMFELVNLNMILTIIISLLAIWWWRIKIKDMKLQKEIHEEELKREKLALELEVEKNKKYIAEKLK